MEAMEQYDTLSSCLPCFCDRSISHRSWGGDWRLLETVSLKAKRTSYDRNFLGKEHDVCLVRICHFANLSDLKWSLMLKRLWRTETIEELSWQTFFNNRVSWPTLVSESDPQVKCTTKRNPRRPPIWPERNLQVRLVIFPIFPRLTKNARNLLTQVSPMMLYHSLAIIVSLMFFKISKFCSKGPLEIKYANFWIANKKVTSKKISEYNSSRCNELTFCFTVTGAHHGLLTVSSTVLEQAVLDDRDWEWVLHDGSSFLSMAIPLVLVLVLTVRDWYILKKTSCRRRKKHKVLL